LRPGVTEPPADCPNGFDDHRVPPTFDPRPLGRMLASADSISASICGIIEIRFVLQDDVPGLLSTDPFNSPVGVGQLGASERRKIQSKLTPTVGTNAIEKIHPETRSVGPKPNRQRIVVVSKRAARPPATRPAHARNTAFAKRTHFGP